MPRCEVKWLEGRTLEQQNEIAQRITKSFTDVLGCPDDAVVVVFRETDPAAYYTGAVSTAQRRAQKAKNKHD